MAEPLENSALEQRVGAADLRVWIADTLRRLDGLRIFRRLWEDFVDQLRPLIRACDGDKWPPEDPLTLSRIDAADELRLDLRSRLAFLFPGSAADPLGKFLNTSLRMSDPRLYELVGVPVSLPERVVGAGKFEAVAAECVSVIAERTRDLEAQTRILTDMLAEAQRLIEHAERAVREERSHELAKVAVAAAPTFRAWLERRRLTWPWKLVWPFVEKPLRNVLWPILVAAGLTLWQWLRWLL